MRFLFHIRSDARIKSGGDVNLMKSFKDSLESMGHAVDITYKSKNNFSDYDIALAFNYDRPYEPCLFITAARRGGCKTGLYTIHHNNVGFYQFLKYGSVGYRKVIAGIVGFDAGRYETVLNIIKILFLKVEFSFLFFVSTKVVQRRLLSRCDYIFTSSNEETKAIVSSSHINKNEKYFKVVPHILSSETKKMSPARHINRVICPGRIESRKNQLSVLKMVSDFPFLEFVFVGAKNTNELEYWSQFSHEIEKHNNASYLNSVNLIEYRELLLSSSIFISASWVEVVSLAELEAYLSGCKLIVSENSYISEYILGDALFFNPGDVFALKNALEKVVQELNTSGIENRYMSEARNFASAESAGLMLERSFSINKKDE